MANRRFEMFEYRQIIYSMRLGESNRAIVKARLMGRKKAAKLRAVTLAQGWLRDGLLPDDAQIAAQLTPPPVVVLNNSLIPLETSWFSDILRKVVLIIGIFEAHIALLGAEICDIGTLSFPKFVASGHLANPSPQNFRT